MRSIRPVGPDLLVAVLGSSLIVVGAVLPWIRAQSAEIGHFRAEAPSMSLATLGAADWRWILIVLAVAGLVLSPWCRTSLVARRALLLVGMLAVVSTVGVYHGHGYAWSYASWGPILTIAGGLLFAGIAVASILSHERTSKAGEALPVP